MTRSPLRLAVPIAAGLLAGGCSDVWLGGEDGDPLPGERISILAHGRQLAPDPETAGSDVLLPRPAVNPEWPQSGGYASHAMHHTRSADLPRRAWEEDIGSGSDDTDRLNGEPVIADGKVFTIDADSEVRAFDARTGDLLWARELTPDREDDGHIPGGLAYYRGGLFVTTGFAEVFGLNARTGKVFWRHSVGAPMRAAPAARDGKVFVTTLDDRLLALDAATGNPAWTYQGVAEPAGLLGSATPAVDQGIVVGAFLSGDLVALDADGGRELWTQSLAPRGRIGVLAMMSHIRGDPVIDRDRVFAINHGGLLVSVDLRSGQRVWEQDIGGINTPWVAGDHLFVLTEDSQVVCLSRRSGGIHWVSPLPRFEDPEDRTDAIVWAGPLLASDRLVVAGSNGAALTLSPYDGRLLGRIELPDRVTIPPVIADATLYFLADDATLVAFR